MAHDHHYVSGKSSFLRRHLLPEIFNATTAASFFPCLKRGEKVEEIGQAIIKSLKEIQLAHQSGDLNSTHLDACYHSLRKDYDPEFGGFGNKPKFPTSHTLSFLLRYFKRTEKHMP